MKSVSIPLVLLAMATSALANTAPTVVIQSATMRPGTTLMDVVYRVNDPDDATVKTRALAFVDGVRSFAKVIRPVTFVEGTAAKLGDAIPANVDHTLTWDVAADWDIDLGQIKFEVLAMDGRGLLPFDWITIPAAGGKPALTISSDPPTDGQVLDALVWRYADSDPELALESGILRGSVASGVFAGVDLANAATLGSYGAPFIFKRMNLNTAESAQISYAVVLARAHVNPAGWHATQSAYNGIDVIHGWGNNVIGQITVPAGLNGVTAIAAGANHSLALKSDGTVVGWGSNGSNRATPPAGLSGVITIAAGSDHSLALKNDGTVVGWGTNIHGQTTVPTGLNGVTSIAAGNLYSLALKSDGTVVGWGYNNANRATPPADLSGVIAIAAGDNHSLALRNDGTVVGWGNSGSPSKTTPPTGLSGVIAISAGNNHSIALKDDGTVVAWGSNTNGQTTIPAGISGVTAISAGPDHNLALKSDGTVVCWGNNSSGQITIPVGLNGVTAIAASGPLGSGFSLVLKARQP